ncbi:MAG TPA: hypothetical protein VF172_07690 [Nitrososphaera sp.]|jgi:hypothetical protein
MSQLRPPPPPSLSGIRRALSGGPKDGDERIVSDKDDIKHLEYFENGNWKHIHERCRTKINPICNKD